MRNDSILLLKEKKVGFIIKECMNGEIDINMRDFGAH